MSTAAVTIEGKPLEVILQEMLSQKYQNIHYFCEGGTRTLYLAEWGPGKEKRVIKVDKLPNSPRALRHTTRGYTTANDIKRLAQITNPEEHHLMRLCDFEEIENNGRLMSVSVEPYFESVSLEELLRERALTISEFKEVFGQVIEGVNYLIQKEGMYHRDLKPSNILIGKNIGKPVEEYIGKEARSNNVRITDFANACKIDEAKDKILPTAGGHFVTDPLLIGNFTGVATHYTEQAEIYALGTDMYFALTGKYLFEYDPDNQKGKLCATQENLLDKEGRLNVQKHELELERALKRLPKYAKRYREVIKRCLTLDESSRYNSVKELLNEFEEVTFENKSYNISRALILMSGFVGVVALGGILGYQYQEKAKLETVVIEETKKYPVGAQWNGQGLEVKNNFVELQVNVFSSEFKTQYPEQKYVVAKAGGKISLTISAQEVARPEKKEFGGIGSLPGKMYIEGYSGKRFYIYPRDYDGGKMYGEEGMGFAQFEDLQIPANAKGRVMAIVELYAPTEEDKTYYGKDQKFRFETPGKILSRKRIPIFIDDITEKVDVESVSLNNYMSNRINFWNIESVYKQMKKGLEYQLWIPEDNWRENTGKDQAASNMHGGTLGLPDGTDTREKTLVISIKQEGQMIGYNFIPIKRKQVNNGPYFWNFSLPGEEFSTRIIDYRKILESGQK